MFHPYHLLPTLLFLLLPINSFATTWATFQFRFRVTNGSSSSYTWNWWTPVNTEAHNTSWSPWSNFTSDQYEYWVHEYPNTDLPSDFGNLYMVAGLYGVNEDEWVNVELDLRPYPDAEHPFAPATLNFTLAKFVSDSFRRCEFLLFPEPTSSGGYAPLQTSGEFNYIFYLSSIEKLPPPRFLPKDFIIADAMSSESDEVGVLSHALSLLQTVGVTALDTGGMESVDTFSMFQSMGMRYTAMAIYEDPWGSNDYGINGSEATVESWLQTWADKWVNGTRSIGWSEGMIQAVAIADEPGAYYPSTYTSSHFTENPRVQTRWQTYLKSNGLTPEALGGSTWDEIHPMGRGTAFAKGSIEARRLFYWTFRFLAWDSGRFLGLVGNAVSVAAGAKPGKTCERFSTNPSDRCVTSFSNYNNFQGRAYTPGPFGNNPDKSSIDSATGAEDWYEAASAFGSPNALFPHTEDWFADYDAYQWSFMATRLRAGATRGKSGFGGYIVGRTVSSASSIPFREFSLIAHGATYIRRYTFGPEYVFPGNSYSEGVWNRWSGFRQTAEMVGFVEQVLLNGTVRKAGVQMLGQRSSTLWDEWGEAQPSTIRGITNWDEFSDTSGWWADAFGWYYVALNAGIPVEIIDEDVYGKEGMEGESGDADVPAVALIATAPEIPLATRDSIVSFVENGGLLVAASGTGRNGRYGVPANDSKETLWSALGVEEREPIPRDIVFNSPTSQNRTNFTTPFGTITALGPISSSVSPPKHSFPLASNSSILSVPVKNGSAFYTSFTAGTSAHASGSSGLGASSGFALASLLRQAIVNASTTTDDFWRAAPVGMTCGNRNDYDDTTNNTIMGVEARVIDAPSSSLLTLFNWTTTASFAAYAAIASGDAQRCPHAGSWNVTFSTPSPSHYPKSVRSFPSLTSSPFSVSSTPTNATLLVSFEVPITSNVTVVLIDYK